MHGHMILKLIVRCQHCCLALVSVYTTSVVAYGMWFWV